MDGFDNRDKIQFIKTRLYTGVITYEQAKAEAQPLVDAINAKGREIAKKYNRRYTPIGLTYVLR